MRMQLLRRKVFPYESYVNLQNTAKLHTYRLCTNTKAVNHSSHCLPRAEQHSVLNSAVAL